jgi:hypothetical protein
MVVPHPTKQREALDAGKASRRPRSAPPLIRSGAIHFMDRTSCHSVATGQGRQDQLNVDLQCGIPKHHKSCHFARFESRCSILVRSDPLWRGEAAESFAVVAQLGFLRSADDRFCVRSKDDQSISAVTLFTSKSTCIGRSASCHNIPSTRSNQCLCGKSPHRQLVVPVFKCKRTPIACCT